MRRLCRAGVILCGFAAGCTLRGNTAALENELRGHESRILSLENELRQTRGELAAARRESEHLRERIATTGEMVLTSEQADVLFRAEGLRINTLLTGGLDEDGRPGDELLSVVLEPFDADEQTLKLPGEVTIELIDPAAGENARTIGRWNWDATQVRDAWHSSLIVAGFKFRLDWSSPPAHETLVLHARLTTSDGRVFDATETVKIELPVGDQAFAAHAPQE